MELRVKPNVDFLTKQQIENTANELLNRYQQQVEPIASPPIPIEFIVEDFLKYEIQAYEFHETNTLAFIDPNEMRICFNLKKSDYFDHVGYEYTMAHEIGHAELGHFEEIGKQLELGLNNEPTRFLHRDHGERRYIRHEFQAEYYGACLIMPKYLISSEIKDCDLLKWSSIYLLAAKFKVSVTAMTKRLTDMKLIYVSNKTIYNNEQEAYGMRRLF